MPESTDALRELQQLRHDVEDLKGITASLLHSQPDLAARVLVEVKRDATTSRILLLVNGDKSQNEILLQLQAEGMKGASLRGVSERFERLTKDWGLISFDRRAKAGNIYRRTALDGALKISQTLEREARGK